MKRLFAVALISAMLLLSASAFAQTASFGSMMGSFGAGVGSSATTTGVGSTTTGFGMMTPGSGFGSSAMSGFTMPSVSTGQGATTGFQSMTGWMQSILTDF